MKALSHILVLVLAVAGTAHSLEIVGSVDLPTSALDVFVYGRHAYLTGKSIDLTGRLWVIDIGNTPNFQIVSSVATNVPFSRIFCSGNYSYTEDSIVDISNPAAPEIKRTGPINGFIPRDVFVSGSYAYMVDPGAGGGGGGAGGDANGTGGSYGRHGGFYVVDISEPLNPVVIGSIIFPTEGELNLYVSGSYAYLGYNNGLKVVDVSNPAEPQVIASLVTYIPIDDIYVQGHYAYAVSGRVFFVFDMIDPRAPRRVGGAGFLQIPGCGIHVAGRYAYVAAGSAGLYVIDITDSLFPAIAGAIDTPGSAGKIFVSGNYAYVADGGSGLQVVDISEFQAESAIYEPLTSKLHIPCLEAEGSYYWAGLGVTSLSGQIVLQTADCGAASGEAIQAAGDSCGTMDPATMSLHIPRLNIDGTSFWADFRIVPLEDRWVLGI